jgi:hypothetical protein
MQIYFLLCYIFTKKSYTMEEKAKVFLTTGQCFMSPLANIDNIRRIYKDKLQRIEYPNEKKEVTEPTPEVIPVSTTATIEQKVITEAAKIAEQPKVEIPVIEPVKVIVEQTATEPVTFQSFDEPVKENVQEQEPVKTTTQLHQEAKQNPEIPVKKRTNTKPADYSKSKSRLKKINKKTN